MRLMPGDLQMVTGPLHGVRVVELASLGPGPFCGMVLADLGADVIRVDRVDSADQERHVAPGHDLLNRGKRSIAVDLKHRWGVEVALSLAETAELLIEPFRPGVAERLGIGPAQVLARRPALVYGRMTGWGQDGPLAERAGHDIDYIAISGALHGIGTADTPIVPLNLVGDIGGGAMLLAVGLLAALTHARRTGEGQVVDASMVDGSALLTTAFHGYTADGAWTKARAGNLIDGGAPFYSIYATADGGHVAVGALEPRFFAALLEALSIDPKSIGAQGDRAGWPEMRERFAAKFLEKGRDEWNQRFAGLDACVAPILDFEEAAQHEHNLRRRTFVEVDGVGQPAPAPRFSSTPAVIPAPPVPSGHDTDDVLRSLGFSQDRIGKLREVGAVA